MSTIRAAAPQELTEARELLGCEFRCAVDGAGDGIREALDTQVPPSGDEVGVVRGAASG